MLCTFGCKEYRVHDTRTLDYSPRREPPQSVAPNEYPIASVGGNFYLALSCAEVGRRWDSGRLRRRSLPSSTLDEIPNRQLDGEVEPLNPSSASTPRPASIVAPSSPLPLGGAAEGWRMPPTTLSSIFLSPLHGDVAAVRRRPALSAAFLLFALAA